MIDTHCHVPHKKFNSINISPEEYVSRANAQGVTHIITLGTSLRDNLKVIEVSRALEDLYPAIGIYPHEDMQEPLDTLLSKFEAQVNEFSNEIVAIGECGIDMSNWQGGRSLVEQTTLLDFQLDLAVKYGLPVSLHNRNGSSTVLALLSSYASDGLVCVAHSFSQDVSFANKLLNLGCYISFSGMLTYPKNVHLRNVAKFVPLDRLLVETDAPYLPPQSLRGSVNMSENIAEIIDIIAQVRNVSFDVVAEATSTNAKEVFRL